MTKYYLFLASNPLDRDLWEESLSSLIKEPLSFTYESDRKGYILASEKLGIRLQDCLYNIHEDLGITVTVVIAHRDGALEEKLLREALSYFPNQCLYLTDMLMKELSFGDYSSFPLLSNEFRNVPHDLIRQISPYLSHCDEFQNEFYTSSPLYPPQYVQLPLSCLYCPNAARYPGLS